jgi:quercetin dioxygenase-like cupin family protein
MPSPSLRRADDIDYAAVDAAPGLEKGVLIAEEHGAPNFAIRRFTLEAGAEVPKHTNEVEHEQYVLEGEYVVGISEASETPRRNGEAVDDEEHTVSAGDSLLIPSGTVHWVPQRERPAGLVHLCGPDGR